VRVRERAGAAGYHRRRAAASERPTVCGCWAGHRWAAKGKASEPARRPAYSQPRAAHHRVLGAPGIPVPGRVPVCLHAGFGRISRPGGPTGWARMTTLGDVAIEMDVTW